MHEFFYSISSLCIMIKVKDQLNAHCYSVINKVRYQLSTAQYTLSLWSVLDQVESVWLNTGY